MMKLRKWLLRCSQKAMRVGKRLDSTFSWSLHSPHYSGHLTRHFTQHTEQGKPVSLPLGKPLWPIVVQV